MDKRSITLSITALVFIITGFLSPIIFTQDAVHTNLNFTNTGEIGDTIGGIMNPFIAVAGVIVTYLAFYMQLQANNQALNHFEISMKNENRKEKEK